MKLRKASFEATLCLMGLLVAGCAHQPRPAEVTPPIVVAQPSTPAAQPVAVVEQKEQEDLAALLRGTVIHFEFDAAQLTGDSQLRLQKLAEALRVRSAASISIAGNCDDVGTDEYNLALGQKRAEVAKKYLVGLGVEPTRIDTVSYGEEHPLDTRSTSDARAANRRDEFLATRGL